MGSKTLGALKYTLGFVIAFIVLILIGLLLRPSGKTGGSKTDWINDLLDTKDRGQNAIFFVVACVMMLGVIGWVAYGGYGASAWPIGLIRGKRQLSYERSEINSELDLVRAKSDSIKYKRAQTAKDKLELSTLQKKERLLASHATLLSKTDDSWVTKVSRALRPFAVVLGVLLFLLALLLVASLTITSVDRAKNSPCGKSCGWTLNHPKLPNPLDILLVKSHKVFPIDYVLFTLILLFFFFASLSGIMRIGVRFAWLLLYKIRPRKTVPQGVLLMAMILNFLILTLNMQVLTLAPQYSTFGYQSYVVPQNVTGSGTVRPCQQDAPQGSCTTTRLSHLVSQVSVQMPFFGVVFFYQNWAFLAIFVLGALFNLFKARAAHGDDNDSDSEAEI